jgi:hypothetical protein
MTEYISAYAQIPILCGTEPDTLRNSFLEFAATRGLEHFRDDSFQEEMSFLECLFDEYLDEYEENIQCQNVRKKMLESLSGYLSEYTRMSHIKDKTIEIWVHSDDMEYDAFEFLINSALRFAAFETNKILVCGQTYSSRGSGENSWEDCYSLEVSGETDYKQKNHMVN